MLHVNEPPGAPMKARKLTRSAKAGLVEERRHKQCKLKKLIQQAR